MFLIAFAHPQFALWKPLLLFLVILIKTVNNMLVPLFLDLFQVLPVSYEKWKFTYPILYPPDFHYIISFCYYFQSLPNAISANKVCRTVRPAHKHRDPNCLFFLWGDLRENIYISKNRKPIPAFKKNLWISMTNQESSYIRKTGIIFLIIFPYFIWLSCFLRNFPTNKRLISNLVKILLKE